MQTLKFEQAHDFKHMDTFSKVIRNIFVIKWNVAYIPSIVTLES